jgi:hypothetical protein
MTEDLHPLAGQILRDHELPHGKPHGKGTQGEGIGR